MPFADQFSTVPAGGLQSVSLVFGAASLAQGLLAPPFKDAIYPMGPYTGKDVISVDVTIAETHSAQVELTQHPVETGADITDHARQKPREVHIEGFVTNNPLDDSIVGAALRAVPALGMGLAVAQSVSLFGAQAGILQTSSPIRDAFDAFQRLYANATLVQVFTPFRTYSNMVMTEFEANREQQYGDGLKFKATFREVFFVASQLVTISAVPAAQGTLDMGTQSPTPSPAMLTASKDSALYQQVGVRTTATFRELGLAPRQ